MAVTVGCRVDRLIKPGGTTTFSPDTPTSLGQYRSDGITSIGAGSTIDEASVVLRAAVSDSEATDTLRLQVEVRPVGTAFSGSVTHESPAVLPGADASVSVGSLDPNTAYRWQARAIDRGARTSEWVVFGDGTMSFRVAVPRGPTDPTNAEQFRSDGTSAIGVGSETSETTVMFAATVSDPDDGAQIRLQVEVRPTGTAFSGVPTGQSSPVSSGERAMVAASVADETAYHWQYRADDGTGRFSAWRAFGGNPDASPDFLVAIDDDPGEPTASAQLRLDGTTPIPAGGSTPEMSIILAATPTDPDPGDQLRLQVEVQRIELPLTGLPTHTSAVVAAGARATITVDVIDGVDYRWQFRTIDQTNRTGPWASFGGNADDAMDFRVTVPDVPAIPLAPGQFHGGTSNAIAVGGSTSASSATLSAIVTDSDAGATVRFEVEVRQTGVAFTGTPTHASTAEISGERAEVTVPVAAGASYHWRYRAIDETSRTSEWTSFGGNADGEVDFSAAAAPPPPPPGVPGSLGQFGPDSTTAIAVGATTSDATVVLAGTVSDTEAGSVLTLEFELRLVGAAFTNTATGTVGSLSNGQTGKVALSVAGSGGYHWQARTCRGASCSGWVSFGGNAEAASDFARP